MPEIGNVPVTIRLKPEIGRPPPVIAGAASAASIAVRPRQDYDIPGAWTMEKYVGGDKQIPTKLEY